MGHISRVRVSWSVLGGVKEPLDLAEWYDFALLTAVKRVIHDDILRCDVEFDVGNDYAEAQQGCFDEEYRHLEALSLLTRSSALLYMPA